MSELEKNKDKWIWKEDISTWFMSFATILATWLVFISLVKVDEMSQFIQNAVNIVATIGALGLPIVFIPIGFYIFYLMRRKAQGTLTNQRLKETDIQNQTNKELLKAIINLNKSIENMNITLDRKIKG